MVVAARGEVGLKRWLVPVTLISSTIGVLLSVQYKSQIDERQAAPSRRLENLAFMLKSTEKANQQLSEQVNQLQERVAKRSAAAGPLSQAPGLSYPPMEGPGLEVTLSESGAESKMDDGTSAVVHAEDLLKIINELRSGGAEAVALNGQRLTEVSEVITAGQHVVVNKRAIVAPYVIAAIGPASEMRNTLQLRGGVVEYLQFYGITVKAEPRKKLMVPGADWLPELRHAVPSQVSPADS